MKILEFYTAALADMRIVDVDGEGLLTAVNGDQKHMVTMPGNRRLCLPTQEILRQGVWTNLFPFHPLSENVTLGASEMIEALREYAELRLNQDFLHLFSELANTAANTASQKKIGAKASQYLRKVKDVDEKFVALIDKIADQYGRDPTKKRLVNVFLLRGGVKDNPASRTAVVTFPLLDEIAEYKEGKLFGLDVRKKDIPMLKALHEYILFGMDEPDMDLYTFGTRSMEAPFLHALLTSFYKLAARFNQLAEIHGKHIEDADSVRYDLSWVPALDNFHAYRGVIPPLEGNIGNPLPGTRSAEVKAPQPQQQQQQKPLDLPWETGPSQATTATTGPKTMADFLQAVSPNPLHQQQQAAPGGFNLQAFRNQNHEQRDFFGNTHHADRYPYNNRLVGGRNGRDWI